MSTPTPHSALLLLPPPPHPPSHAALKAAYSATVVTALTFLARPFESRERTALLTVTLPVPYLRSHLTSARAALYSNTQRLIAGVYKLVTLCSAQIGLPTDPFDPDGVDARLVLLAWKPENNQRKQVGGHADRLAVAMTPEAEMQGPITTPQALARSGRQWDVVYGVQTEEGEELLKEFLSAARVGGEPGLRGAGVGRKDNFDVQRLGGGAIRVEEGSAGPDQDGGVEITHGHERRRHWHVAVGGTFDHLHTGHKLLLTLTAFAIDGATAALGADADGDAGLDAEPVRRTITVGITGDELLKNKKFAQFLEPWERRQQAVQDFLMSILDFTPSAASLRQTVEKNEPGLHGRAVVTHLPARLTLNCVDISDPFGPTVTDADISALVLSAETRAGGQAINERRRANGWEELAVFEVDVLDAEDEDGPEASQPAAATEDFHAKLSSTQIRRARAERPAPTSGAT